jgi:hypothetical protein
MQRKLWVLALVGAILLSATPVLADGDFYVVAAGGGVGTKISSLPYEIKTPGFYYVTGNLTGTYSWDGISVKADNVTIDLMGFTLTGNADVSGSGIKVDSRNNVEIRNGTLKGWQNGGIYDSAGGGANYRILNLRTIGSAILVGGSGGNHQVKGCTISNNSWYGVAMSSGTITGNVISNILSEGSAGIMITNGTVSNNVVKNCLLGIENYGGNIVGNTVYCNSGQTGIFVQGNDANSPVLLDRNSAIGAGTHFAGTGIVVKGTNAGF